MAAKDIVSQLAQLTAPVKTLIKESSFPGQITPDCLKRAVRAYPDLGGKMMRPALVLGACGMFDDGRMDLAIPVAASTEIFHDWTLVHDDIIDNDDMRRGKPSTHRLVEQLTDSDPQTARTFGRDMAILAGDIQQEWANMLILESNLDDNVRLALLKRLNGFVGPQLISGEAEDVAFELREFADITPSEIIEMLRKKTGILLRFAAEAGAMCGRNTDDPSHPDVRRLGDFAETVGLAFQLQDDLLGMFADEATLGKPVGSDLKQGKRTYLFAKALDLAGPEQKEMMLNVVGNPDCSQDDVDQVVSLLISSGAKDAVEQEIAAYKSTADSLLEDYPENDYKEFLLQWAEFACTRSY